jgi:hypothetical protein
MDNWRNFNFSNSVGLNSVHREIVSSVTIVFYDKVRGRNKEQRWLPLVCCGFFIWKRYNRTHFHRTILWLTTAAILNGGQSCQTQFCKGDHPRTIAVKFGLIWFSSLNGEDLNVIFYQNMPNLHNRYKLTERKISQHVIIC